MNFKNKLIGVIYGGRSIEREGSLVSGKSVHETLLQLGYNSVLLDPQDTSFYDQVKNIDCAFIALHGINGEDGKIQGFFETLSIPYTGCGVFSHAMGMNKVNFKNFLKSIKVNTPNFSSLNEEINLNFPVIIKPENGGGSLGIQYIDSINEYSNLQNLDPKFSPYFVEEFIKGDFITVGVLGKYGKKPKILHPVQVDFNGHIYDYKSKRTSGMFFYSKPNINKEVLNKINLYCNSIYNSLQCNGAVRIDFIKKNNELYVIEINTSPGLSKYSNLQESAKYSDISYEELIKFILDSAYTKLSYIV